MADESKEGMFWVIIDGKQELPVCLHGLNVRIFTENTCDLVAVYNF